MTLRLLVYVVVVAYVDGDAVAGGIVVIVTDIVVVDWLV